MGSLVVYPAKSWKSPSKCRPIRCLMPRGVTATPEVKKAALADFEAGILSVVAIGAKYGVHAVTVCVWAREAGLRRLPRYTKHTKEDCLKEFIEGYGLADISECYGPSVEVIRHWAQAAGVRRPREVIRS